MKVVAVCALLLWGASVATAAPVTLVSLLADRPVFSYVSGGATQTRTLSPGNKISLDAGTFSGLGLKKTPLNDGSVYYLARLARTPGLFILGPDQVLIFNQSGQLVTLALAGLSPVQGALIAGNFALATVKDGSLVATWNDQTGKEQSQTLEGGKIYRLLVESPADDGMGLTVALKPWD